MSENPAGRPRQEAPEELIKAIKAWREGGLKNTLTHLCTVTDVNYEHLTKMLSGKRGMSKALQDQIAVAVGMKKAKSGRAEEKGLLEVLDFAIEQFYKGYHESANHYLQGVLSQKVLLTSKEAKSEAYSNIAWLFYRQGEFDRSAHFGREALDLSLHLGTDDVSADVHNLLALAELERNFSTQATDQPFHHQLESMKLTMKSANLFGMRDNVWNAGHQLHKKNDDFASAHLLYRHSFMLGVEFGIDPYDAYYPEWYATLASKMGYYSLALKLQGVSQKIREDSGFVLQGWEEGEFNDHFNSKSIQMSPLQREKHRLKGYEATPEIAIKEAIEIFDQQFSTDNNRIPKEWRQFLVDI